MPIASMNRISDQDNTDKHIEQKDWLTTAEALSYIQCNCSHLWNYHFRGYSSLPSQLYSAAYTNMLGIVSDAWYDQGNRRSRFYSKRSLDRANQVLQYRKNMSSFWESCNELEETKNTLNDARLKLEHYASLVVELETKLKNKTLQRKKESARINAIQKNQDTLTFDANELHKLA